MWVLFLLFAVTAAIGVLIVVYITHRVIMTMENERENNNKRKKKKRSNKK